MRTWLTETFGVSVPVVCAPMAGVAGGRLAGAVSAGGALGMIGVGAHHSPQWIQEQARDAARAGRPFGIGLQAWVLDGAPAQLEATLEAAPDLVSISYARSERYLDRVRAAGVLVATTISTLREARAATEAGADVLVARGAEAGGHGQDAVSTLPLLQAVLDAVDVPVLAAGGIGTSRGLAAVLAAGAAGAWVGTAFLTCVEGLSTAAARSRLAAAEETDTVHGRVFDLAARTDWPAKFGQRALRNQFYDDWVGRESDLTLDGRAATEFARATAAEDYTVACLNAGEGVGLLTGELTAAAVVTEFARAEGHLRRAVGWPDRAVTPRDRDAQGRARQARPRDALGRPLPYGDPGGVQPVSEDALAPQLALRAAQALLDEGRPFSAHEVLEAVWKAAPAEERALWQGLAQLCVGITHGRRGNSAGATRLIQRATTRLSPYVGRDPHGIDVAAVLTWCRRHEADPGAVPLQLRTGSAA